MSGLSRVHSPAFTEGISSCGSSPPHGAMTLDEIAQEICERHSVSPLLLRSPCRRRDLTPLRVELARKAIEEGV